MAMWVYVLGGITLVVVAVIVCSVMGRRAPNSCPACGRRVEQGRCVFCGTRVKNGRAVAKGDRRDEYAKPTHRWDVDAKTFTSSRHEDST